MLCALSNQGTLPGILIRGLEGANMVQYAVFLESKYMSAVQNITDGTCQLRMTTAKDNCCKNMYVYIENNGCRCFEACHNIPCIVSG